MPVVKRRRGFCKELQSSSRQCHRHCRSGPSKYRACGRWHLSSRSRRCCNSAPAARRFPPRGKRRRPRAAIAPRCRRTSRRSSGSPENPCRPATYSRASSGNMSSKQISVEVLTWSGARSLECGDITVFQAPTSSDAAPTSISNGTGRSPDAKLPVMGVNHLMNGSQRTSGMYSPKMTSFCL